MAENGTLSGTERAAILLLTLGEQEAAQILRHMGAREVQRIGGAMTQLGNVSRQDVTAVLSEFTSAVDSQTSVGIGSEDFLRRVLVDALGTEKAATVIDGINVATSSKGLEALKWMDAKSIAEVIRHEHPQIIAIVLAYLDADQASGVLALLPQPIRADIVVRIALMEEVEPTALSELDDIMEKQFSGKTGGKRSAIGGAKVAADIVNGLNPTDEAPLMEEISKSDEALATRIQDLIFVFENLLELDDRGMQELLRQVPSDKLLIALKGTDETMKAKIFKNMSQRAAEMLKDDLEAKGPVKLSEVEAAQKEILAVARKLAEAGTISLGSKGEEYV
jgi:flagellar motor switch protein FliG